MGVGLGGQISLVQRVKRTSRDRTVHGPVFGKGEFWEEPVPATTSDPALWEGVKICASLAASWPARVSQNATPDE